MDMFLKKYRDRIVSEYEDRKEKLPILKEEIDAKINSCTENTALALKYMYRNMPLSDIGNYDFEVFLDYAEQGVYLYEHSPFMKDMPEGIFLNYVLGHRINTEEITPCRKLFYGELKERIEGLSMKEAALEINYWCAEKATYQTTDGRTAAPLTVYRCGSGRCGEESTFTISAMRSAGIPARQVYVPLWSHCDDNHAWVEVWCDGSWYFLGACEPEPILNKGWFTNASSRAMLVHSRCFDSIVPENENFVESAGAVQVLNQLERYAATKRFTVRVQYADGTRAAGAQIALEVLNYAGFAPIARLVGDEQGEASMTTGFGSLHVSVQKDGLYGEALVDVRETELVTITLGELAVRNEWEDFDVVAPVDTPVNMDQPTEEQKEERDRRLAQAAKIRTAKVEAFVPEWKAEFVGKAGENRELCEKLMEVLSKKDRIDVRPEVLKRHVESSLPMKNNYPEDIFVRYVLNPRVHYEVLTDYRAAIETYFTEDQKAEFRKNPRAIWTWITVHMAEAPQMEQGSIYTTPAAALKLGVANDASKKILFVAIARTLGIPARLNSIDGAMEYMEPTCGLQGAAAWEKAHFAAVLPDAEKECVLALDAGANMTWTYAQNWSIAKLEEDGYQMLFLMDIPWKEGHLSVELDPGVYRIVTANRLPNGNVFGKRFEFQLNKGETKELELSFRDAKLSDMLESNAIVPFYVLNADGSRVQAADLTRGERKVLFWLEVSKEPTEHILNELMERRDAFEKYQKKLLFLVKNGEELKDPTLSKCRSVLPEIPVLYDTFTENVNTLGRRMYVDPEKLPLILVTDGELNGIYATSGYNVGTADMLLRILEM